MEEGGRLMGEGVHFFDLANWLLGQSPSAVSAEFVGPARVENPNAEVSISYPDGSVARVQYSTLGSPAMGKEYFEVAGNGRSARCDDYREFAAFGTSERPPKEQGNKGQLGVLEEFAATVRGESSPVAGAGAWDGLLATWVAATAYESASRGIRISRPEE
jgi:predicted dehydrogenase